MASPLGPPVIGDPAGMRALAVELRMRADALGSAASAAARRVDGMRFDAPAADRHRGETRAWEAELTRQAQRLMGLATRLAAAANQVESAQLDRARRAEALAREEQARAAAAGGAEGR